MSAERTGAGATPRPLMKQDIDRRIEGMLAEVAGCGTPLADPVEAGPLVPRWISPAELVDRLRPHVSTN